MIRLYMDENVQRDITRALRNQGVDVVTAQQDGFDATPDPLVMDRANLLGRVLFSRDVDMLAIATNRLRNGEHIRGLVYARQNHVLVTRCIADLVYLSLAGEDEDLWDMVYHLPL